MTGGVYWAADWRCSDCGHQEPIAPGQDTRPINDAHECDSTKLAIHQSERAGWEAGYRFALENLDDELVQADKTEFGTGWMRILRNGGITITADEDEGDSR